MIHRTKTLSHKDAKDGRGRILRSSLICHEFAKAQSVRAVHSSLSLGIHHSLSLGIHPPDIANHLTDFDRLVGLEVIPHAFVGIQLRGVRRERFQVQPGRAGEELLHGLPAVTAAIVQQHDEGAGDLTARSTTYNGRASG